MLTEAQLTQFHVVGLSSTEWLMAMTEVSRNCDGLDHALTDLKFVQVKVIMCRLAYTPPSAIFQVSRSSTNPTNASRAWSVAHLSLGSWHAKLKWMEKKACLKDKQKLIQSTLTTDSSTNTLQLTKKPKATIAVFPSAENVPPTNLVASTGKRSSANVVKATLHIQPPK